MKRLFNVLLVIIATLSLGACSFTKVEPGYAGILVNNYGSQRGVRDFPIKTGRVWYNPFTEDVYKFPTFRQNYIWTKNPNEGSPLDQSETVNSVEGATINFDVSFSVEFLADSVPRNFVEFRMDADHIINTYIRRIMQGSFNRVASRIKVVDIYGAGKSALVDSVQSMVQSQLRPKGIIFDQLNLVGNMRFDERVTTSINSVLQAAQHALEAENKVRQVRAEAEQAIATARGDSASAVITAVGQAEANRRILASLTTQLIQFEMIKKWDGKLPLITGGNGTIPMINADLLHRN